MAASVEKGSEHPLGEAIWAEATNRGLALNELSGFKAEAGYGVEAEVEGRRVTVGNVRMMESRGYALNGIDSEVTRLQSEAKTVMLVAIDGKVEGVIAVADTLKDNSKDAIEELHRMGLKVAMITGDNRKTAEAIAEQVGVDDVLAEVLPEGKSSEVKKLQSARILISESRISLRWSVTASMTRPRWLKRTSALRLAQAPTWPWLLRRSL